MDAYEQELERFLGGSLRPGEIRAAGAAAGVAPDRWADVTAAAGSPKAEAWKRREAVRLFLSSRYGRELSDLEQDGYRSAWFGDQTDDAKAYEQVRAFFPQVRPGGLMESDRLPEPKRSGIMARIDEAIAPQAEELQGFFEVAHSLAEAPQADTAVKRTINAAERSLTISAGGMVSAGLSLAGLKQTARAVADLAAFRASFYEPDANVQWRLEQMSGQPLVQVMSGDWWQTAGGDALANMGLFTLSGMAGFGVAGRVLANPLLKAAAVGAMQGIGESGIEAGTVYVEAATRRQWLREQIGILEEHLNALAPAERAAALQAASGAALREYQDQLAALDDPDKAAQYANQVLRRNLVLNTVLGALQMGTGAASVKRLLAGRVGAVLGALGLVGVEQAMEQEQEQYQEGWTREALTAWTAGRAAELDLLPGKTLRAFLEDDPEGKDIAMATLLQSGRSAVVNAAAQWGELTTLAQADERRRQMLAALRRESKAGNAHAAALLAKLDTPEARAPGAGGLTAFGERLVGAARTVVARTHDAMASASPEQAAGIDPDGLLDDAGREEGDQVLADIEEDREALATAEAEPQDGNAATDATETPGEPAAATTAEPATPAAVEAAPAEASGPVRSGRDVAERLAQENPKAGRVRVIADAEIPAEVRARQQSAGKRIRGYRDADGTMVVVADNLGAEDVPGEVVRVWVHEQAHQGVRSLFADDRARVDAFLDALQARLNPEALVGMLDRTGLSPEQSAQDTERAFRMAADEYLARLAEKVATDPGSLNATQKSLWREALEMVREGLRRLALRVAGVEDLRLSEGDLQDLAIAVLRGAGVERVPAGHVQARQVVKTARRQGIVPGQDMPVMGFVSEQGGIVPKARAKAPGGEYDGQPSSAELLPFAGAVFAPAGGGLSPDQAAAMLHERGLVRDAYPDTMWETLRAEVKAWRNARKADKAEAAAQEQAERFVAEVLAPGAKSRAVAADSMHSGDVLTARGEAMTVVGIDPDGGAVELAGGERYGTQTVDAGTTLYPEAYEAAGEAGQGGEVAFSLGDETEDARVRYEATAQWMRAPNGQPTNLSERQWLAARENRFAALHGPWERLAQRRAIEALPDVPIDDSLVPQDVRSVYAERADGWRSRIVNWAVGILPASTPSVAVGVVAFTRGGLRDAVSHGRGPLKLLALPRIPQLLNKAVRVGESERGVVLASPLIWRGDRYVARLVVRDAGNGTYFYDHEFSEIERLAGLPMPEASDGIAAGSTLRATRATGKILAEVFSVNSEDVSVPLDANGEPTAAAVDRYLLTANTTAAKRGQDLQFSLSDEVRAWQRTPEAVTRGRELVADYRERFAASNPEQQPGDPFRSGGVSRFPGFPAAGAFGTGVVRGMGEADDALAGAGSLVDGLKALYGIQERADGDLLKRTPGSANANRNAYAEGYARGIAEAAEVVRALLTGTLPASGWWGRLHRDDAQVAAARFSPDGRGTPALRRAAEGLTGGRSQEELRSPYLPGLRFSLSDIELGPRERVLAAAVAGELLRERSVGVRSVGRRLQELGLRADAAPAVVEAARGMAASLRAERLEAAGDREILAALAGEVLRQRYRGNIERTGTVGASQQAEIEKAYRRVEAWRRDRVRRMAEKRTGLSDADLEAAGQRNLPTRLAKAVADFAPKKAPKPEAGATAEPEAAGGADGSRQGRNAEDFDAAREEEPAAEAAALAPLPAELPTDPVDVAALKKTIVETAAARLKAEGYAVRNANTDPVLRREVAATWARLLRGAAWEHLRPGARREWIRDACRELELQPGTLRAIDRRVSQLAYWVSREAERTTAEVFVRQLEKLLNLKAVKGRTSQREELIRRKIEPLAKGWLRVVRDVYAVSEARREEMLEALKSAAADFDNADIDEAGLRERLTGIAPSVGTESVWQAMAATEVLDTVHRAVSAYAAIASRPPGEIADAVERLRADYETGLARIEQARERRRERLAPTREALCDGMRRLPEVSDHTGRKWLNDFVRGGFSFYNGMQDLIRYAKGEEHARGAAGIKAMALDIQAAHNDFTRRIAGSRQALEEAVRRIYGTQDVEGTLRRLEEPQEAFRRFSRNKERRHALSRANLLFVVAALEQQQYAANAEKYDRGMEYLREVRAALTPQDLALLDWLRGWYRDNRSELSARSMEVLGVPVLDPDPLYHPVRVDRPGSGLAEMHYSLQLAPETFEQRRRHGWDIDETASPVGLYHVYAEANARFLSHVGLAQDLRYVYGHPETRAVLEEFAGRGPAKQVVRHVTEIAGGRGMGQDEAGAKLMARARAATLLAQMSGNVGSGLRQLSAIPAFALTTGPLDVAKAMAWNLAHPEAWAAAVHEMREDAAFREWASHGYSEPVDNAMRQRGARLPGRVGRQAERLTRLIRLGMRVQSAGIQGAVFAVAPALYVARRQAAEAAGFTPEAARRQAMTETLWTINQTQGSSQVAMLSPQWRGSNQVTRMLMQFTGPTAQLYEWEALAIREAWAGTPGSRKRLLNVVVVNHVLIPSMYMAMKALWEGLRGDWRDDPEDEREETAREMLAMMLAGPVGGVVLFGSLAEATVDIMAGRWNRGQGVPAVELATRLFVGVWRLGEHLTTDFDLEEALRDWDRVMSTVSAPWRDASKAIRQWGDE